MTAVAVHEDTEDDLVVEAKNEGADGEKLYSIITNMQFRHPMLILSVSQWVLRKDLDDLISVHLVDNPK